MPSATLRPASFLCALCLIAAAAVPASAAPVWVKEPGMPVSLDFPTPWLYTTRSLNSDVSPRPSFTLGVGVNTFQGGVMTDREFQGFDGEFIFQPGSDAFTYVIPEGLESRGISVVFSNYGFDGGSPPVSDPTARFGNAAVAITPVNAPTGFTYVDMTRPGPFYTVRGPQSAGTHQLTGSISAPNSIFVSVEYKVSIDVVPVPEPASLGLLAGGALLLTARRRRA